LWRLQVRVYPSEPIVTYCPSV